ncbi:hypothetical protein VE01_10721 [Pseudogymnoascus verrucosus]|uniref:Uncharacterized protein n=1 Tax=Pseudogymnoascus verrucosus TaxID=342668 RepID=A0A1B8G649_9PEZI|nr:uncharacterized protein VE01_10721 [Pseudogymnoascus verrucosus]OBT91307.1 hypothetical protein VE01_10721 [Pseudogymnoascus verrucosus]
MARNDSASNVGSKGKAAVEPVLLPTTTPAPRGPHPLDKLKIAFLDTFNGDHYISY